MVRFLLYVLALTLINGGETWASAPASSAPELQTSDSSAWVAQKKKKKRRKKRRRRRKRKKAEEIDQLFGKPGASKPAPSDSKKAPPPPPAPSSAGAPVLDLTQVEEGDADAAREELLSGGNEGTSSGPVEAGAIDFGSASNDLGGNEIEFGGELVEFDLGTIDLDSPERARFDEAMVLMSDEDYTQASQEFRFFLDEPAFKEFVPEAEYQLAKALYKMGFLDSALRRFRAILEQGPNHRRYRKSIEWLFFISRKVADETPVLAELARFRNVKFPKAYRNEYNYLLAKYLFVQAQQFEIERVQREELARSKKATGSIDFSALSGAVESGGVVDFGGAVFDFGGDASTGAGGALDFGGQGASDDGGFDFGGGDAGGSDGSAGFDFGGGASDTGAGFDFGTDEPASTPEGPVRTAAPANEMEAIRQALDFVRQVEGESKWGPRARYLEGLLLYMDGSAQDAVQAYQAVVRELNPREGSRLEPKLREQAFLSLARIHYGYKQFNKSAYYYDQIDRDSGNWLNALFEASWAYYRRGDFEKALGNLLTLHSPFFEREYFPESQIVKSIIYFEACRYAETREIIDIFLKRYTRVMKELERIVDSKENSERLYDRIVGLQAMSETADDDVTARVVSLALADPEIRTAQAVVQEVDEQRQLLLEMEEEFRTGKLGRELTEELDVRKRGVVREGGEVTRKKFEQELYALRELLAQAIKVKIEVVRSEREIIQARMRGESTDDDIVPAVARTVVDDERLYWPFEGEYWRDELGTYELDFSMCRSVAGR